jgi:hypothetical protein
MVALLPSLIRSLLAAFVEVMAEQSGAEMRSCSQTGGNDSERRRS